MDPDAALDFDDEPDPALNRISNAVIGAAIAVHRELGPGYQESVYQGALAIEFEHREISFRREMAFPILYRGMKVGEGRLDFLVENLVVVELKAVDKMTPLFTSQVISYMKASNRRLTIMLNFNVRRMTDGIQRVSL